MHEINKFKILFPDINHRYLVDIYYGSVAEIIFYFKEEKLYAEYDIADFDHFLIVEHEFKTEFLPIAKEFIKTEPFQEKILEEYHMYIKKLKIQLKALRRNYDDQIRKNKILAVIEKYKTLTSFNYLEKKKKKLENLSIAKVKLEDKKAFLNTVSIEMFTEKGNLELEFMINDGRIEWYPTSLVRHYGGNCKFCKHSKVTTTCYWFFGLEFELLKKVMFHRDTRIKGMMFIPDYYKIVENHNK